MTTPEQIAAMSRPVLSVWPWAPTALVGLPVETVRRVVLAEIHALRQMANPLPQGVRL